MVLERVQSLLGHLELGSPGLDLSFGSDGVLGALADGCHGLGVFVGGVADRRYSLRRHRFLEPEKVLVVVGLDLQVPVDLRCKGAPRGSPLTSC